MNTVKTLISSAILIAMVAMPLRADVIHKWVDESGVTHYSDQAPALDSGEISLIELPEITPPNTGLPADYYTIASQWQRLLQERLERDRLKLEQHRQPAATPASPPEIIYVRERRDKRYVSSYRAPRKHHRPPVESSPYLNHPNKRLMYRDYPPGLHPGRNLRP